MRTDRYFPTLILLLLFSNCEPPKEFERINASFLFINDTDLSIVVSGGCGFEEGIDETLRRNTVSVPPGDSLLVTQQDRIYTVPPSASIDNIDLFPGSCFSVYGDSMKCEFGAFTGIRNLNNYEKKEEVSENNFEFTYRFTNQTMNEAQDCP